MTAFTGVQQKTVIIHQNIFCQTFEELVSIKIYHHQNLYYMVSLWLFLLSSTLPVRLLAYSPLVMNL